MTNTFDWEQLLDQIQLLPPGKAQMDALQEAIQQADAAQNHYWRLMFRV